ncbi:MAG: FG-GAP-like repeat-containing protein [Bdellovibrionia bacterium]
MKFQFGLMTSVILGALLPALESRAIEVDGYSITSVGKIGVRHPGFLTLSENSDGTHQLLISTFGLWGKDSVRVVDSVGDRLQSEESTSSSVLTDQVVWPNEIQEIGAEVFGHSGWIVSGGFLVPGKTHGALTFIDRYTHQVVPLTRKKKDFFYHRFQVVHWGEGGRPVILTARAKKPIFGSTEAELVMLTPKTPMIDFKNEKDGSAYFEETVLSTSSVDVFFDARDLTGDGREELIAAEFFSKKLELFWWEGSQLQRRLIDSDVGALFDLRIADLNADGELDLLVTDQKSGKYGSVYAYEIPRDLKSGAWTKHVLLDRIQTRQGGIQSASPGSPLVFYPSPHHLGKPWILISGDGSQRAHLLTPVSSESTNWSYRETIVLDSKSTIGSSAIADVDGDGNPEIFIPQYDGNQIDVLRIEPIQSRWDLR